MIPLVPIAFSLLEPPQIGTPPTVRVASRQFAFTVDTSTVAAVSWENRRARTRIDLAGSREVELEIGDDPNHPTAIDLQPAAPADVARDGSAAVIRLRSADGSLTVAVTYRADSHWPVMHKAVEVTNSGSAPVRLLNVVLGRYPIGGHRAEGGERGFPLYLDGRVFLSLTHPAGFCHVEGSEVVLRQYPGVKLAPGGRFESMEALYGVARTGDARKTFVSYVRSRMVRVTAGHDKPYAILDSFGGQPEGDFKENFSVGIAEGYLHRHLAEVADSEREKGVRFDFYCLEFWHDRAGDLTTFNRTNFPNGFDRTRDEILALGMKPALWIDSGGLPFWSIDQNPAVKSCFTHGDGIGEFCRASEPINTMYKHAFVQQMRDNKVGLFKFDNLGPGGRAPVCDNPAHDHLPGPLYSTEAIYNAVIDFLGTLREANPDVFVMLYWGYRSPWWLQWGDTYFECGDAIEAASPAQYPTPFARDAVTQRLDQAQLKITDTPWLGKDSLGVWLSDWAWNSGIGKARWQEGVIMDMARGGLLFQLWTDAKWLTSPERTQVATFIDLMKANASCFDRSRCILGNPNNAEPYGYSCCDSRRAFLAIDNACLRDSVVRLQLGSPCGLPSGKQWDVYRWYPRPSRLIVNGNAVGRNLSIPMRPYEVALLEVVPAGEAPSLGRSFTDEELDSGFAEQTCALPLEVLVAEAEPVEAGRWTDLTPSSAVSDKGASLTVHPNKSILASGKTIDNDTYTVTARVGAGRFTGLMLEAMPDNALPGHGPGRAENGNYALTRIRVYAVPEDHPDEREEVKLSSATADFSQTSFGGWPVSAAIDDDPQSGWSIHPQEGMPHAAVFTFARPLDAKHGTILAIEIVHGNRGHSLGNFRLAVTRDDRPALPSRYQPGIVRLSSRVPATRTGGLLLLAGGPDEETPHAQLAGQTITLTPVWSTQSNWGCPWTAWRAELDPAERTRALEITLQKRRTKAGVAFTAHFLPL